MSATQPNVDSEGEIFSPPVPQDEASPGQIPLPQTGIDLNKAEQERELGEEIRHSGEAIRRHDEALRTAAESQRMKAEESRELRERQRQEAETFRIVAEENRQAAEMLRIAAEDLRQVASRQRDDLALEWQRVRETQVTLHQVLEAAEALLLKLQAQADRSENASNASTT
jgi:hypothetical protein